MNLLFWDFYQPSRTAHTNEEASVKRIIIEEGDRKLSIDTHRFEIRDCGVDDGSSGDIHEVPDVISFYLESKSCCLRVIVHVSQVELLSG